MLEIFLVEQRWHCPGFDALPGGAARKFVMKTTTSLSLRKIIRGVNKFWKVAIQIYRQSPLVSYSTPEVRLKILGHAWIQ